MSKVTTENVKQSREPPPPLFLGSPSLSTSYVSLSSVNSRHSTDKMKEMSVPRVPFLRQASQFSQQVSFKSSNGTPTSDQSSVMSQHPFPRYKQEMGGKKIVDNPDDAQWLEMQRTLKEVEMSATKGIHVFGTQHSKALEDLRNAQIELANAWARSESEEAIEDGDRLGKGIPGISLNFNSDGKPSRPTASSANVRLGNALDPSESESERTKEKEFDADIIMARKRREANDRYFQRLNDNVLDVVSKLEEVSSSIRAVARESKNIWENIDVEKSNKSVHDSESG
ncbi:hypothetical protein HI914_03545 [Erysiphe necator]|uniref:Uncharacterized protein n=1 Tax=Uncinula necator TaxID=52586 RepID=A0A0B1P8F7_UNCNE|nr:hypothetical protein HI914_03545 [Erysiphe necator]KHJ34977.1 hypothetical protein EV44_g0678 [Erysiphe necator]